MINVVMTFLCLTIGNKWDLNRIFVCLAVCLPAYVPACIRICLTVILPVYLRAYLLSSNPVSLRIWQSISACICFRPFIRQYVLQQLAFPTICLPAFLSANIISNSIFEIINSRFTSINDKQRTFRHSDPDFVRTCGCVYVYVRTCMLAWSLCVRAFITIYRKEMIFGFVR